MTCTLPKIVFSFKNLFFSAYVFDTYTCDVASWIGGHYNSFPVTIDRTPDLNHGTSLIFSLQEEGFAQSFARDVCHGPHRHRTFDFTSEMTTMSSHFQVLPLLERISLRSSFKTLSISNM